MPRPFAFAAAAAALVLGGCSSNDPYARTHSFGSRYEQYRPSLVELARIRSGNVHEYEVSDLDIVNYTDHVKAILRSKFTNARFARYTSATGQVLLGSLAGAAAAFDGGATTVAALALSSAALPQVGGIFNAKARAESYQDAVRLIEEAETDYLTEVGTPSSRELTANGVDLYRRVSGTIHIVEKAIVGQLPTLKEMKDVSGEAVRAPRRRKEVINVLSGRTTATSTSTTVFPKRAQARVPNGTQSLDDLPAAPPARRTKVHIPANTPSLDDEPGQASSGGTRSSSELSQRAKEKRSNQDGGAGASSANAEKSAAAQAKRQKAKITAETESLDTETEKKRSKTNISPGTASLDEADPHEKRSAVKINESTKSLDTDTPSFPSR